MLRHGEGSWAIGGCWNALALQPPLNLEAPSFSEQAPLVTWVFGGFCPRPCKLSAPVNGNPRAQTQSDPLAAATGTPCRAGRGFLLHLCHISSGEGALWAPRHLDAAQAALPAHKPARRGEQGSDLLPALGCCCCGSGRGVLEPALTHPASNLGSQPQQEAFGTT